MLILFQRDSATVKEISKLMKDSLYADTSRSSGDTSYLAKPSVVELPSVQTGEKGRLYNPTASAQSSGSMQSSDAEILGTNIPGGRYLEIYHLLLKRCANHPMHSSLTLRV